MGILQWFKERGPNRTDRRLRHWRERWSAAVTSAEPTRIESLRRELDALGFADDDIEIEREMLEALTERETLAESIRSSGLPHVETGHRVVRNEPCHYSEPASMPDKSSQPSGRLLLTSNRAIFVGSGTTVAAAWHTIATVVHAERDVVLVKNGGEDAYRFRCNTYGHALCAAFLASEILRLRRSAASHG